jgi:YVTN family beta-propeller protein
MMRNLVLAFAAVALATACADREMTAPLKAPAGTPSFTLSPTPERTFAYVANFGSDNVSIIRTSDNTVVATIAVGDGPDAVGITPSGGRVYVANFSSDNVSVIRTSDNTVTATIPVGHHPQDVAIAPDGGRVFVLNADGTVSVIRTSDNTVVTTIDVGDEASTMAITPDGSEIYVNRGVTSDGGVLGTITIHSTSVIRTSDYTVRGSVDWFLGSPDGIAITPDGSRAYLPDNAGLPPSSLLRVIQTSDLSTVTSLALPTGLTSPGPVAITPNGSYAYVVKRGSSVFGSPCSGGAIWIIPTATNTIETTVPVGCFPNQLAFTPDGARAYVTNNVQTGPATVEVVSTSQKAVIGSVAVGVSPRGLAIGFVPTPTQLVDALEDLVSTLGLSSGIEGSLLGKLNSALSAIQAGKTRAACGALQDFVSQVSAQSGKKITIADATALIGIANQVRELIGC